MLKTSSSCSLYLADEGSMKKTANAFGIAKCTISKIIYRVTKAFNIYLGQKFIKLPNTAEEVTKNNFFGKKSIPEMYWSYRWNSHSNKETI